MHGIAIKLLPLMLVLFLASNGCSEKTPLEKVPPQASVATDQTLRNVPSTKAPGQAPDELPTSEVGKMALGAIAATKDSEKSSEHTSTSASPATSNPSKTPTSNTTEPTTSAAKTTPSPRPFHESAFISSDAVGLIVIHPQQFFDSPLGQLLKEFQVDQKPSPWTGLLHSMNLRMTDIERITIVIDQEFVNSTAKSSGLHLQDVPAQAASPLAQKNALKQIGLGFHNYHDVFSRFPRANGDGEGQKTGLSWRVHILPFIDQANLYNEFRLDEPWDSEHNQKLIARMPELFNSPGVTEDGKTAFQVFTGEKTLFTGDQGHQIGTITDGTSNTILVVLAGSDAAQIWTKPGGLEVDLAAPKKSLGKIEGEAFLALKADGAVLNIPSAIDDLTLSRLIQPADGAAVDLNELRVDRQVASPPSMIIRLTPAVNQSEVINGLLSSPTATRFEEQTIQHNDRLALWFPDDRTATLGTIDSIKSMVAASRNRTQKWDSVERLRLDSDLSAVFNLQSQAPLIREISKWSPMLGMINNVDTVSAHLATSLEEGRPFVDVEVKARDSQMALGLSTMADVGLSQLKQTYQNNPLPPGANDSDREMRTLINRLLASAKVTVAGDQIQLRIPTPAGFDRVPDLLRPTFSMRNQANR